MANLLQLAAQVASKALPVQLRHFDSSQDLTNAILAELWNAELREEESEPMRAVLFRAMSRITKRENRYRERQKTTHDMSQITEQRHSPGEKRGASANADDEPHQSLDLESLGIVPRSRFEQEVALAEAGIHPRFSDFADLASSQLYCSKGEAYKRRKRFFKRVCSSSSSKIA